MAKICLILRFTNQKRTEKVCHNDPVILFEKVID